MSATFGNSGCPTYEYTTPSATSVWVINHNLNKRVVIDVVVVHNGVKTKIIPKRIVYNNLNTVTVEFSKAMSGVAILS